MSSISSNPNVVVPETCEFDTLFRSFDFDIVNGARLEPLSIDPAQYFFFPAYEDNIPVEQAMSFPQVTHEDVALQGIGEEEPSPLHRSRDEKYKAYQKEYKKTHREENRLYQKEYRKKNIKKYKLRNREYKETHEAEIAAKKRKYHATHKKEINEKRKITRDIDKLFLSQPDIFDNFPVNLPLDKLPNLA